jgi:hypothetical protein
LGWVLLLGALGALGFALFLDHEVDPARTRRTAAAELMGELDPGEVVLAQAPVVQRLWWDYFRRTYGVLAATDRRLVFVGIPPEPLLHRDAGPPEASHASFRYARGVGVRLAGGRRARVTLASGSKQAQLEAGDAQGTMLRAVLDTMRGRMDQLRAAGDAERRAIEVATEASRRATYHLVQPGEALEQIARRYGSPVDSVRAWNDLSGPRIVVGQRLLVRPGSTS